MKKTSNWAVLAWVLIIGSMGCSRGPESSTPAAPTGSQPGGLTADSWQIRIKSNCAAGEAVDCQLAYGLVFQSDGNYRVGPGPQGQSLTGPMTSEDRAELTNFVQNQASGEAVPEVCIALPSALRTLIAKEEVVISHGETERIVYQVNGEELCFRGSNAAPDAELALKNFVNLHHLAGRYYPLPFPNENCESSIASLSELYSNARRCEQDADCSYFDPDFVPVDGGSFKFLLSGSCSGVVPLVVASRALGAQMQGDLMQAFERARTACRARVTAAGCAGFPAFLPTQPLPVCVDHACRVNPAVGFQMR